MTDLRHIRGGKCCTVPSTLGSSVPWFLNQEGRLVQTACPAGTCNDKQRTAMEVLDDRLNKRSSGLKALALFLSASLDDKNPSKPCMRTQLFMQPTAYYIHAWPSMLAGEQQCRACSRLHVQRASTLSTVPHWLYSAPRYSVSSWYTYRKDDVSYEIGPMGS